MEILDNPISEFEADQLNRTSFARSISQLILNAPKNSSFRIGVYADWGEGKTSVLRLVEKLIREDGHVSVWLFPWTARSSEQIWEKFIQTITEELQVDKKALRAASGAAELVSQARGWADADWKLRITNAVIGGAIQKVADKIQKKQAAKLLPAIYEKLGDRKLVVFIDDLDRTRPELVPEILLSLREALDLPQIFYVMAVSPQIVEEGLKSQHRGWTDADRFLEKIVEWPFYLPRIPESKVREFAQAHAENSDAINADIIGDMAYLLPRNPRKIKLFLRSLVSLSFQLQRFLPEEIDLFALYLIQLLKLEFPDETNRLAMDSEALKDIEAANLLGYSKEDEKDRREFKYRPENGEAAERFTELMDGLRKHWNPLQRYRLQDMLCLIETPPMLTWKEMNSLFDRYCENTQEATGVIREWVEMDGEVDSERAQALFDMAVDLRQSLLSQTVDFETEEEIKQQLPRVSLSTQFLRTLVKDLGFISSGMVSASSWLKLSIHLGRWAAWREPAYYLNTRAEEIGLFSLSGNALPDTIHGEVLAELKRKNVQYEEVDAPEFKEEFLKLVEILERTVSRQTLSRFEKESGLDGFWSEKGMTSVEKAFAFDPSSKFHSEEFRTQLEGIAQRASHDTVIHQNFLTYFRMLAHGALEASSFQMGLCRELLQNSGFTKLIWTAAIARPLNRRTVGDLRRFRDKLISILELPEEVFPTNKSWKTLESTSEPTKEKGSANHRYYRP